MSFKEDFIDRMDAALTALKVQNRSQFIRDAIQEKLSRMGVKLPRELALPSYRYGRTSSRQEKSAKHISSTPPSDAAKLARRAAGEKV
jgi:metal-responsive CopG/Arc/MetJ family transcriptional regulator